MMWSMTRRAPGIEPLDRTADLLFQRGKIKRRSFHGRTLLRGNHAEIQPPSGRMTRIGTSGAIATPESMRDLFQRGAGIEFDADIKRMSEVQRDAAATTRLKDRRVSDQVRDSEIMATPRNAIPQSKMSAQLS